MEPLTVAIGAGLVVSLVLGEFLGITAGGMVVPGYIAANLSKPSHVALTLAGGIVTMAIVRSIASVAIVYGRRRTALMILVGFLVGAAVRWAIAMGWIPGVEIDLVGHIIPGLLAIWLERQGIVDTLATLVVAAVIVRLALIAAGLV